MSEDTYEKPTHGWTCFHCGETFHKVGLAKDHFGATPGDIPGCVLKVQLGPERGLLMALRKVEMELARHIEEDTDLHRALHRAESRHADALMQAEEAGYARGLADGRKECSE